MKHKKGKSSLYNVSILKLLKTKRNYWHYFNCCKKNGVVLSVSGEDELDIVLVCKSISSCTHTQAHTHTSYPQTGFSWVCSVRPGRWKWRSAEFDLFCGLHVPSNCLLLLLSDFLHFTEWLDNNLRTCLDLFSNRWTDQKWEREVPIEKK